MSLLVYSRTAVGHLRSTLSLRLSWLTDSALQGYRHASIPTAQDTIQDLGYNVTLSEDPAMFDNTTSLEQYEAIIFLSTSGEILDTPQQKYNLEQFLLDGGGMIGFHTATGSLYTTPFYGQAFGAWFAYHPEFQQATFEPLNDTHPSTRMLPDEWTFEEEVYNFDRSPLHTQNTEVREVTCRLAQAPLSLQLRTHRLILNVLVSHLFFFFSFLLGWFFKNKQSHLQPCLFRSKTLNNINNVNKHTHT